MEVFKDILILANASFELLIFDLHDGLHAAGHTHDGLPAGQVGDLKNLAFGQRHREKPVGELTLVYTWPKLWEL